MNKIRLSTSGKITGSSLHGRMEGVYSSLSLLSILLIPQSTVAVSSSFYMERGGESILPHGQMWRNLKGNCLSLGCVTKKRANVVCSTIEQWYGKFVGMKRRKLESQFFNLAPVTGP